MLRLPLSSLLHLCNLDAQHANLEALMGKDYKGWCLCLVCSLSHGDVLVPDSKCPSQSRPKYARRLPETRAAYSMCVGRGSSGKAQQFSVRARMGLSNSNWSTKMSFIIPRRFGKIWRISARFNRSLYTMSAERLLGALTVL